jgi:uncharacterized protein (TIGR03083 family)
MNERLHALEHSVEYLALVVARIDPANYTTPSYADEWTIADVLSHIGSGSVIAKQRVEDLVAGRTTGDDFNQSVWDEWNAKQPLDQVNDALAADKALLSTLTSLTDVERAALRFPLGPMVLDFDGLVGLRLNEHVLHTWDVEVTLDAASTLTDVAAGTVIDNLELIARFAGKPTGEHREWHVRTKHPTRDFVLTHTADAVTLTPSEPVDGPDLEINAEAFVRLVYGRLDGAHRPSDLDHVAIDQLAKVFPGF